MNIQAQLLKHNLDYIFERIEHTVRNLSEEEATWMPCQGSNDINWILTHMARIGGILIPQVIHGTVKPGGWEDNYEEQPHSFNELMDDLIKSHEIIRDCIDLTDDDELNMPLTFLGWETDRKSLLFHLMAELMHHQGQIAMLRGIYKRNS